MVHTKYCVLWNFKDSSVSVYMHNNRIPVLNLSKEGEKIKHYNDMRRLSIRDQRFGTQKNN